MSENQMGGFSIRFCPTGLAHFNPTWYCVCDSFWVVILLSNMFLICRHWTYGDYFPLGCATGSRRWIWRIQKQENFVSTMSYTEGFIIAHVIFFMMKKPSMEFNLKEFKIFIFDWYIAKENNPCTRNVPIITIGWCVRCVAQCNRAEPNNCPQSPLTKMQIHG